MSIIVNGVDLVDDGVYSIDVNGDGIKDGVRLNLSQSITGEVKARTPLLELRDEEGEKILFMDQRKLSGKNCGPFDYCEELAQTKHYKDSFAIIDDQKVSSGQMMLCGSAMGVLREIEFFINNIIVTSGAPAFFPGQLIHSDADGFVFASAGAYLTLEDGTVHDISECSAYKFSSSAQTYWDIAIDYHSFGRYRLEAAAKLLEIGEVEPAKAAYRSIGIGDNQTIHEDYRMEAAEALAKIGSKSDAVRIYYSIAIDSLNFGTERLEAAAKLAEIGEVELAKEAYRSICTGDNQTIHEDYRMEAAEALKKLESE